MHWTFRMIRQQPRTRSRAMARRLVTRGMEIAARLSSTLHSRTWIPVALSLFLLSPLIIFDVVLSFLSGRGIDKLVLFALPTSVLFLILFHSLFRRPAFAHLVLFPFYVPTVLDLYFVFTYEARLTSSAISVLLENAHHTVDMFRTKPFVFLAITTLFLLAYGAAIYAMRDLRSLQRGRLTLYGAALVCIYAAVTVRQYLQHQHFPTAVLDVISHDRGSPFGVIPQGATAYQVYRQTLAAQAASLGFTFGVKRTASPATPEVYVLIIGESSRRDHWSLFGYNKPTTPRLDKLAASGDLIPLSNMITQEALTRSAVPLLLTRRTIDVADAAFQEKSIVSAFKEAGFRALWLSTQQRDQWTGAINRHTAEADHVAFFERRHDGVLLAPLAEALQRYQKDRLFVVLHTQGSHFVFADRYPQEAAVFPPVGSARQRMISEYDNTIAYTDWFISSVIAQLQAIGGTSALMYVADHGENLYDDSRGLFGHMYNNEFDLPVPALIWFSKMLFAERRESVKAGVRNKGRPVTTRSIFHTLADIGALVLPGDDTARWSVLSNQLRPYPRLFAKGGQILDYDSGAIFRK